MGIAVIEEFLSRYSKEYDYYQKIASICAQQCESNLNSSGIRAIVTYRAKRPDRLKIKLEARHKNKKNYESVTEIYNDIVDLAGVRIAVYFPKASEEVDSFIRSNFELIEEKTFPEEGKKGAYDKRFSGYGAHHYRVKLKMELLSAETLYYGEGKIEIQVASVLMHAWAEVEHDLVYKPLSGKLSDEEYKILDELNGLVLSGEIALERLQDAGKHRVSRDVEAFNNHYDLSSFLYSSFEDPNNRRYEDLILGNTRLLYVFLESIQLNKAGDIKPYINRLDPDDEKRNIVDQLIEYIIQGNKEYYEAYDKVRRDMEGRGERQKRNSLVRESALGYFISRWIILESLILEIGKQKFPDEGYQSVLGSKFLRKINLFNNNDILLEIENLRRLRNEVIHGIKSPDEKILLQSGEYIEDLLKRMLKDSPQYQELIEQSIKSI